MTKAKGDEMEGKRLNDIEMNIHFSDFFSVDSNILYEYGAFNISLINDLPLFIDPFLLFQSKNPEYRKLHDELIKYVKYLRNLSTSGEVNEGLLSGLYVFPEVKQNWLGFSCVGNSGRGLGLNFARSLNANLQKIFQTFGEEKVTKSSHLEKLSLIKAGVGRDCISDFTTNLIKGFLLDYTEKFARKYMDPNLCDNISVNHVSFNYETETWNRGSYFLPVFYGEYVLLTPKDMLTKDDTWINRGDMLHRLEEIADALPDNVLRAELSKYLFKNLMGVKKEKERLEVFERAIQHFPEMIDHYVHHQEEHGEEAVIHSENLVAETNSIFVQELRRFVDHYLAGTPFYSTPGDTLDEARERVAYLKQVIEHNDGYKLFYNRNIPIRREEDVQRFFRLTLHASISDVNSEVNNGRGPVDVKISRGSADKCLVEFKLASNTHLKRNLQNQVQIYEAANQTKKSLKVIIYFTETEQNKVIEILKELGLEDNPNIILIDARDDNKPSASKA